MEQVRPFGRPGHVAAIMAACLMVTACGVQIQQHPNSIPFHVDWATPTIQTKVIGSPVAVSKSTKSHVNSSALASMSSDMALVGVAVSGDTSQRNATNLKSVSEKTVSYGLGLGNSTQVSVSSNGGFGGFDGSNLSLTSIYNTISNFLP